MVNDDDGGGLPGDKRARVAKHGIENRPVQ